MTDKPPVAKFLERKYIQWISECGEFHSQKDFAAFLEVEHSSFNRYYNGRRSDMEYQTALKICKKVRDFELLEILGYPPPSEEDLLSILPPGRGASIRAALEEIKLTVKQSGAISEEEADEILSRHGWKSNDI